MKNISVATRIAVAIMLVAVTAVTVTFLFGLSSLDGLFRAGVDVRFEATRAGKVDEVTRYLRSLESETSQLATSPMTVDAARRFITAYGELPGRGGGIRDEAIETLLPLYRDEYLPELMEATGRPVSLDSILPQTSGAVYLQTAYFGAAGDIGVEPDNIDDAFDGSTWSAVHAELHPVYRDLATTLGFADIFIIDADTSSIVYSVAKNIDFATSLDAGPGSGGALSAVATRVWRDPTRGSVTVMDFTRYTPDLASPMAFFGSPILDGERLIGILVTKISTDGINEIMTNREDWEAIGLGDTGEAFIVGSDGRLRSDSRVYVEDPETYFEEAVATGTLSEEDVPGVKAAGTTALFQRMDLATLDAAGSAGGAAITSTNYLGIPVMTTLEPLGVDGLDWSVVVQASREEIASIVNGVGKASAVTIVMFILILTFVSVAWASGFVRPVRTLTRRLRAVTRGEDIPDGEAAASNASTTREFAALTAGIEEMAAGLVSREHMLDEALKERSDIVRRFLPADVVRRLEAGERDLVERIPNATVVAIVIDGLGTLADHESADDVRRRLDRVIIGFDDLAAKHGLERVKIVGDTYFAVCGLGRPYLDHAPRSVAFAEEALRTFAGDRTASGALDVSIGIASGPIAAGLAGSHRLIYDTWGATVSDAGFLARAARPNTVVASASVIEQLPESVLTRRWEDISGIGPTWEILTTAPSEGAPA